MSDISTVVAYIPPQILFHRCEFSRSGPRALQRDLCTEPPAFASLRPTDSSILARNQPHSPASAVRSHGGWRLIPLLRDKEGKLCPAHDQEWCIFLQDNFGVRTGGGEVNNLKRHVGTFRRQPWSSQGVSACEDLSTHSPTSVGCSCSGTCLQLDLSTHCHIGESSVFAFRIGLALDNQSNGHV